MKWLAGGCLCWVIAAAVLGAGIWHFATALGKENQQFKAPGKFAFAVEPGKDGAPQSFKLWHDYDTVFENQVYRGRDTDGMTFELRNDKGDVIEFPMSSMSENMSVGGTSRSVIARTTLNPGNYVLEISGLREPSVFSVSIGDSMILTIAAFFGTIFGSGIGGVTGLILVIVGIVKIARSKKRAAEQAAQNQQE